MPEPQPGKPQNAEEQKVHTPRRLHTMGDLGTEAQNRKNGGGVVGGAVGAPTPSTIPVENKDGIRDVALSAGQRKAYFRIRVMIMILTYVNCF